MTNIAESAHINARRDFSPRLDRNIREVDPGLANIYAGHNLGDAVPRIIEVDVSDDPDKVRQTRILLPEDRIELIEYADGSLKELHLSGVRSVDRPQRDDDLATEIALFADGTLKIIL